MGDDVNSDEYFDYVEPVFGRLVPGPIDGPGITISNDTYQVRNADGEVVQEWGEADAATQGVATLGSAASYHYCECEDCTHEGPCLGCWWCGEGGFKQAIEGSAIVRVLGSIWGAFTGGVDQGRMDANVWFKSRGWF